MSLGDNVFQKERPPFSFFLYQLNQSQNTKQQTFEP